MKKVSIVIPTYNRADMLRRAIESAISQTYQNKEIIVVDDGSTDNTGDVAKSFMDNIIYVRQKNGGPSPAKNTGLRYASGDYICNLDDDDQWLPQKLQLQVDMMEKNPDMGLCGTGVYFLDKQGNITRKYIPPDIRPNTKVLQLLRKCLLIQSSVMIRREVHDQIGEYNPILSEDYEMWLRAVRAGWQVGCVKEHLTKYQTHDKNITKIQCHKMRRDLCGQIHQFVQETPMETIVPGLKQEIPAYALIGLVVSEHQIPGLAEKYFDMVPDYSGSIFARALMKIHQKCFGEAELLLAQVDEKSPFAAQVKPAFALIHRCQRVFEIPGIRNESPEICSLRRDLSNFRMENARFMYHMAQGKIPC